jgi:hypothetical protein
MACQCASIRVRWSKNPRTCPTSSELRPPWVHGRPGVNKGLGAVVCVLRDVQLVLGLLEAHMDARFYW